MKFCKVSCCLVVVGILAGFGFNNAADDMQKFQGSWTLVSGEVDGQPIGEQDILDSSLVIVGDEYTVEVGSMVVKGTQTLNADTSPKQIDGHDTTGPNIGLSRGIYEFVNDDELRVSFSLPGHERPTTFVTKVGTGNWTHVWRRVQADE
ncbi:MAG TPA: TIGR03067 domain-containing protein [Pirellulales bacterium]|nr:TIGR03067 domain-containing protein [Pirellulales bacterium]